MIELIIQQSYVNEMLRIDWMI